MAFDAPEYFNRYAYREALEGKPREYFRDDFDSTKLKPIVSGVGAGSYVQRSFDMQKTGEACMKIAVDVNAGNYSRAGYVLGLPFSKVVVVDFWHTYEMTGDIDLELDVTWFYKFIKYVAGLKFDTTSDTWFYESGVDVWTEIPNSKQNLYEGPAYLHRLRLVIDFERLIYVYMISDSMMIDLSEYPAVSQVLGSDNEVLRVMLTARRKANTMVSYWYIDDFVLAEG